MNCSRDGVFWEEGRCDVGLLKSSALAKSSGVGLKDLPIFIWVFSKVDALGGLVEEASCREPGVLSPHAQWMDELVVLSCGL